MLNSVACKNSSCSEGSSRGISMAASRDKASCATIHDNNNNNNNNNVATTTTTNNNNLNNHHNNNNNDN